MKGIGRHDVSKDGFKVVKFLIESNSYTFRHKVRASYFKKVPVFQDKTERLRRVIENMFYLAMVNLTCGLVTFLVIVSEWSDSGFFGKCGLALILLTCAFGVGLSLWIGKRLKKANGVLLEGISRLAKGDLSTRIS